MSKKLRTAFWIIPVVVLLLFLFAVQPVMAAPCQQESEACIASRIINTLHAGLESPSITGTMVFIPTEPSSALNSWISNYSQRGLLPAGTTYESLTTTLRTAGYVKVETDAPGDLWDRAPGWIDPCISQPTPQQGVQPAPEVVRVDVRQINPPPAWWTKLVMSIGPVGILALAVAIAAVFAFAFTRL